MRLGVQNEESFILVPVLCLDPSTGTGDYLGFVSDRAGKYCCFSTSVIFT